MSKNRNNFLFHARNAIFVLFNPNFWTAVNKRDKEWDLALNRAMDKGVEITDVDDYTCVLGGMTIWISNYPYGYGHPYDLRGNYGKEEERIPYALTRRRLKKYITEHVREQQNQDPKLDFTQSYTQRLNEKLGE